MTGKIKISSGAKWEDIIGYSRAVKAGNIIEVAGTTAVDGERIIAPCNAYEQTKYILSKIENVLKECGSSLNDVIRTRIYVTDISKWEEVGKAHGEFFRYIKPAATMVEVRSLISPDMLVEIEVTAVTDQ